MDALKATFQWGLLAAFLSAAATYFWIRFSRKESLGQEIREEGNKAHYKKKGTPTMGGVAFTAVFLLLILFFGKGNVATLLIALCTLGFGAIGFLDDWEKFKKRESEGLTPKQKLLLQFAFAAVLLAVNYFFSSEMAIQTIPFFGWQWKLGLLSIPLLAFIMVGTVNAVNLTDGLDGLCAGVSLPVFFTIAFLSHLTVANEDGVATAAVLFAGVLVGFLFFNSHPASLFMGDTGSMAIGGALSAMMMVMNRLPFLLVLGGIYLVEALSVIIQVAYFKRTGGKRIFLMSPIHHHFELKGYPEEKVTAAFSLVSVLLCLLTIRVW
ncbi:phospho-N-acetylmuramoyl-pentapeptide-transferase [Murdochiella sp. Marseille-P8839]|nr:phospho-N-acetylmuramoyl-pentapeptide-transferase [Murdochiella sp. Marseille-P8839]